MKRVVIAFAPLLLLVCIAVAGRADFPFELGKPVILGSVEVIPILSLEAQVPVATISLQEAAARNLVRISNAKAGLSMVWVENAASVPLVINPGELVQGGHQDQMFEHLTVVPPGEGMNVITYCIEPNRNSGSTALFTCTGDLAPDRLRSIAVSATNGLISRKRAQDLIWLEVAQINRSQRHATMTGTLFSTLADPEIRRSETDLVDRIKAAWSDSSEIVGTLFCINGHVFSADIFPDHRSFESHRNQVFRMYGLSTIIEPTRAGKIDLGLCREFLEACVVPPRSLIGKDEYNSLWLPSESRLLATEGSPLGTTLGPGGSSRPGFLYGLYLPRQ